MVSDTTGKSWRSSGPCDQDWWYAGLSWFKVLAANFSRTSGQHG